MIVNCDAKGLEWYVATYLAQDKIAIKEILDEIDVHSSNQDFFKLPSRLVAKKFLFRIIYADLKYAANTYANDPEFIGTSSSKKFWQQVIDRFIDKYPGFVEWENKVLQEVSTTGQLIMPTGRVYTFEKNKWGEWPISTIKNWPRQGSGADIMSIARVSFYRRFRDANIGGILVNTVHDSIVCDVEKSEVERVARIFHSVFDDLPSNFKRVFGVEFNLPLRCEVSAGDNMKELTEVK